MFTSACVRDAFYLGQAYELIRCLMADREETDEGTRETVSVGR